MKYIEIPLNKCKVFLTEAEMSEMLQMNPTLFKKGLNRGKYIKRYCKQKVREAEKLEKDDIH